MIMMDNYHDPGDDDSIGEQDEHAVEHAVDEPYSIKNAVLIYPPYGVAVSDDNTERIVFQSLLRAGVLSKKLDGIDLDAHTRLWHSLLDKFGFTQTWLPPQTRLCNIEDEIYRRKPASEHNSVLLIVFCGHGSKQGFVLVEGEKLNLSRIIGMTKGYRGTVVIICMQCYAEPVKTDNPLQRIQMNETILEDQRIIIVHACSHETISTSYINKFMQALFKASNEHMIPPTTYTNMNHRMEGAWHTLYGKDPNVESYKGYISMYPSNLSGMFLRPAFSQVGFFAWHHLIINSCMQRLKSLKLYLYAGYQARIPRT